jgi:hypothetical protein
MTAYWQKPPVQMPLQQPVPEHGWPKPMQQAPPMQVVRAPQLNEGQSFALAQPHAPLTQALPAAQPLLHSAHIPPLPQAKLSAPRTHWPFQQQPPLHGWVAEHCEVHWCVVRSQASPPAVAPAAGQSVVVLQPHWVPLLTHTLPPTLPPAPPSAYPAQFMHRPEVPHAVLEPPVMQVPL